MVLSGNVPILLRSMPDKKKEKNIGILVVHGIGDQKQFDCLKGVAQSIVDSLQSEINEGYVEVSVDINRAETGTFQSLYPAWQEGEKAPINVRIKPSGYSTNYNLHLREVWWADLDRPQNFGKFIKFWFWGLSLWAIPPQEDYPILNDPDKDLQNLEWNTNEDKKGRSRLIARFEYFLIGLFLIVCQPLLFIVKNILRFLDIDFPVTLIADYLGKLRLYQQAENSGKNLIEDINIPPRFSIQRRMINALVRMAISDYDRWYVWSHSLGSIVAYNAFSMPEATLSHYVSHSMWEEIEKWNQDHSEKQLLHDFNTNTRRPKPYRPVWQTKRISRKSLFDKCEGLLTYGSPFWRIADLWPDLVKRNIKHDFKSEFNWYNVIDPSDPVATRTEGLFPKNCKEDEDKPKPLHPQDVFYRTPSIFLLAHKDYLSTTNTSLISQLLPWVCSKKEIIENKNNLYGFPLLKSFRKKEKPPISYLRYHQLWRFIWWFSLIFVSFLIFEGILVVLFSIFQNLYTTFFSPSLQKLSTHFSNDSSLTSLAHFLATFTEVLVCFTPIIVIGLLIWLLFRRVKSNLFPVIGICLTPFVIFLTGYCVIYLADNYSSTLSKIFEAIKVIGHLTVAKLFCFCAASLIVVGLISRFLKKPIKSYILEYLQDCPNQSINAEELMRIIWDQDVMPKKGMLLFNTKTDVIENALRQLYEKRKIRKTQEDNQYYFPYYTFRFINYRNDQVVEFLLEFFRELDRFNQNTNNTTGIRGLRDLGRYIIKELRFNPDEIEKNPRIHKVENAYFLLAPPGLPQLTEQDSDPFRLVTYTIDNNKNIEVDFSCYNFTFINYTTNDTIRNIVEFLYILNQNTNNTTGIRGLRDLGRYIIEKLRFKPETNPRKNQVENKYFLHLPSNWQIIYTINRNNITVDFRTLMIRQT